MIVAEKFVFVHLPRTGGTFVTEVIKKFFPSAFEIGHHMPRECLPRQYSNLPVLGTVRNPWDFYISIYHYVLTKEVAKILVSWMTDNGTLGLNGSLRNLINFGTNNEHLDRLIDMLPEHVDYQRRFVPNISKKTARSARGTGVGYYTFRFNEMFGKADDVYFCRLETLRQDLVTFFEQIGTLTDELRDYVLSSDRKNASDHVHYSTYYTSDLAQLVSIRDGALIKRFGHTFEQPSSMKPGLEPTAS